MIRKYLATAALGGLVACGGGDGSNPFDPDDTADNTDPDAEEVLPIDSDGTPVPGTANATPDDGIVRSEPVTAEGNGFARNFSYDAENDVLTIDNLAFDGDTEGRSDYVRGKKVSDIGPFQVYESTDPAIDLINDRPINQFAYRAIYGVSDSGNTKFSIVRTGSFIGYGFGGFIYQRDGGVDVPTTGQGSYRGEYAGLRDFEGRGGLEYTTADAAVEVDFEDFNNGDAVRAEFTNRRIFDIMGQDITQDVTAAYNAENNTNIGSLPVFKFKVGPNAVNENGEIFGTGFSRIAGEDYESGTFYALMHGDNAEEMVGIVVVESDDPRFDNVTVRETGGFIVAR